MIRMFILRLKIFEPNTLASVCYYSNDVEIIIGRSTRNKRKDLKKECNVKSKKIVILIQFGMILQSANIGLLIFPPFSRQLTVCFQCGLSKIMRITVDSLSFGMKKRGTN